MAEALLAAVEADPTLEITIDVERRSIEAPAAGIEGSFELSDAVQERFLQGLDDIGITLGHEHKISEHEDSRPAWFPRTD